MFIVFVFRFFWVWQQLLNRTYGFKTAYLNNLHELCLTTTAATVDERLDYSTCIHLSYCLTDISDSARNRLNYNVEGQVFLLFSFCSFCKTMLDIQDKALTLFEIHFQIYDTLF